MEFYFVAGTIGALCGLLQYFLLKHRGGGQRLLLLTPALLMLVALAAGFLSGLIDLEPFGCTGSALKGIACPDMDIWQVEFVMGATFVFVAGGVVSLLVGTLAAIVLPVIWVGKFLQRSSHAASKDTPRRQSPEQSAE